MKTTKARASAYKRASRPPAAAPRAADTVHERHVLMLMTGDGPGYLIALPHFGNVLLSGARQFSKGMPISRRLSLPEGSSIFLVDSDENLTALLGNASPGGTAIEVERGEPKKRGRKPAPKPSSADTDETEAKPGETPRCPKCKSDRVMRSGDGFICNNGKCGEKWPAAKV